MTTIAYKDGIMCGETRITQGDSFATGVVKVGRIENFLVGFAGNLKEIRPMYDWLEKHLGKDCDPMLLYTRAAALSDLRLEDCEILIADIHNDLLYSVDDTGLVTLLPRNFESIGTGCEYALGAMQANATAEQAVEIAMKYDINSGGTRVCVDKDTPEKSLPYIVLDSEVN